MSEKFLNRNFSAQTISWVLITTILSSIFGFASSWLAFKYIKREEIAISVDEEIRKNDQILKLQSEISKQDRVRKEITSWANPILESQTSVSRRLDNILHAGGRYALRTNYNQKVDTPNWSMTHDYMLNSTLFIFGEYFSWTQMFKDHLNYEVFQSNEQREKVRENIWKVERAFSSFDYVDYQCVGQDLQVFGLQQRAIGELIMAKREDGARGVITYPEFLKKLSEPSFKEQFEPLKNLFLNLPDNEEECRWKRIKMITEKFAELNQSCKELLATENNQK